MGQTVTMEPLRLEPIYLKTIWAGNRLERIRHLPAEGYGICREVCAYKNSESIIASGAYAGSKISALISEQHEAVLGNDPSDQLIRVAYIDAVEDLSVQVHPNAQFAERVGDYEKSESWYILDAEDGAYISAGVKLTDKEAIAAACLSADIEKDIIRIPVQKGDFVLIPAGLMHACGKNMLALEIGSFGGITYRLYDYGRPRPLDLDKGLAILDPSLRCTKRSFPPLVVSETQVRKGVEHSLFNVDVIDVCQDYEFETNQQYSILTCVENNCVVYSSSSKYNLEYTDTLFIPASAGKIRIEGHCRILKSYRPKEAGL